MRGGLGGVWRGGTGSPSQSPPLTCPGASWLLQGKGEGVTVGTPGPLNLPGQLQAPTAIPNPHCSPNSHRTPDLPRAPQTPLNPPELLHLGSVPKGPDVPNPLSNKTQSLAGRGTPNSPRIPKRSPDISAHSSKNSPNPPGAPSATPMFLKAHPGIPLEPNQDPPNSPHSPQDPQPRSLWAQFPPALGAAPSLPHSGAFPSLSASPSPECHNFCWRLP